MKLFTKGLLLALILMLGQQSQAQNKVLIERIRTAGAAITSIDADLVNKTVKKNKDFSQSGKLYFVAKEQFAAIFNTGEVMIVNKNRMKIDVGILHGNFKLGESGMMRSLSNIFLYGFQGRCQELADDNNYSITINEDPNAYYVVFDNNKKIRIGLGYKTVIFKFDKTDLLIQEITLIDFQNTSDSYTISNTRYNVPVSPDKFVY